MNAYEKLLMTMRTEAGRSVKTASAGLAVMTGDRTLSYNGLELEEEDILIADHLKVKRMKQFDLEIRESYGSSEVMHTHGWVDHSEYIEPLKEGDIVYGTMLGTEDDRKFLVLCRIS